MISDATPKNVFEAIVQYGHDEDFSPRETPAFLPTDELPGSPGKIEALRRRLVLGHPLWHHEDRVDYSGIRLSGISIVGSESDLPSNQSSETQAGARRAQKPTSTQAATTETAQRSPAARDKRAEKNNGKAGSTAQQENPSAAPEKQNYQENRRFERSNASGTKSMPVAQEQKSSSDLPKLSNESSRERPLVCPSLSEEEMMPAYAAAALVESSENERVGDVIRLATQQVAQDSQTEEPRKLQITAIAANRNAGGTGNGALRSDSGTSIALRPHVQAGMPAEADIIRTKSETNPENASGSIAFEELSFGGRAYFEGAMSFENEASEHKNELQPKDRPTENAANSDGKKGSDIGAPEQMVTEATRSKSARYSFASDSLTSGSDGGESTDEPGDNFAEVNQPVPLAHSAEPAQFVEAPRTEASSTSTAIEEQVKYYMDNVGVPGLPFHNPKLLRALEEAGYIKALERLAATNGAITLSD